MRECWELIHQISNRLQYCLEHNPVEVLVQRGAVYFPAKTFHLNFAECSGVRMGDWSGVGGEGTLFYKGWRKGRREREWTMVWNILDTFLGVMWNWPPYMEVGERPKKQAGHSISLGGRLNKLWNLLQGLYWAAGRLVDIYTNLPNLKIYIEVLTKFSHGYHPGGLNTISLSQSSVLEAASGSGEETNGIHIPRTGKEPLIAKVQLTHQLVVISSQWPPQVREREREGLRSL